MPAKQIRISRKDTLFFGPGDGMARNEIFWQFAKNSAGCCHGDALHAANVRNHLVFKINVT